ncbi:hypothetical protein [Chryseobacterium sp. Leaf180]|uniref:hypothetical protein n=1 Tax=Chryseobacterium sp. Leaf180 TaxID=1736289 RepID=UPI00103A3F73|nr:hypothetical protein [Chryseobacterium sp. Leaf180]
MTKHFSANTFHSFERVFNLTGVIVKDEIFHRRFRKFIQIINAEYGFVFYGSGNAEVFGGIDFSLRF